MRAFACALMAGCGFAPTTSNGVMDAPAGGSADGPQIVIDAPDAAGPPARRKPITIHGAMITGMQTDFPVWIDLTDPDIATRARNDGKDIFFTAANGTALDYQIQRWNQGAKVLQAWVRLPTLMHNVDATIYVNYGDLAKATTPPNPGGVFKSSFAAVWHLDDTLAGTAIAEATSSVPGTGVGLTTAAVAAGQLGNGIAFDGTGNQSISFANPITGNGAHTISAWVKQSAVSHTSSIVELGDAGTDVSRFLYGHYGTGATIAIGQYNDDWTANNNIEGNGWLLVHWVNEGGNRKNHIYINANEIAGSPHTLTGAPATAGAGGLIGNAPSPSFGANNGMLGVIDEVRIATVVRDANWISTEYANQNTPSAFYAVGTEQVVP